MNLSLQKRDNSLFTIEGFDWIDRYFASFICEAASSDKSELVIASLLVSYFTSRGHLCIDIPFLADKYLADISEDFYNISEQIKLPHKERWLNELIASRVVGSENDYKPLILDRQGRLYLYKYYKYERYLADSIKSRILSKPEDIDHELLKKGLARYFSYDPKKPDWQCIAAIAAVRNMFTIISGGPGTGKTTTIVNILALLIEQYLERDIKPVIALAAPTGKAAGRMKESIMERVEEKNFPSEIKEIIPIETFTIHRLLQPVKDYPYFRYNRDNLLPCNILVVDESSMVDIALISRLYQAVPPEAKIIMLGDRDQLSSVEAGAVFADLCSAGKRGGYSIAFTENVETLTGIKLSSHRAAEKEKGMSDMLIELEDNYRFGSESGIGKICEAVKRGSHEEALDILKSGKYSDIKLVIPQYSENFYSLLGETIARGYKDYFDSADANRTLKELASFKILCALRRGFFGVYEINSLVENIFHRKGAINRAAGWYNMRPVMISRNDYRNNLFNGDMGVAMGTEKNNAMYVYFLKEGKELKKISTAFLPEHETAYAITVHKSQGSEFGKVLLILPDRMYPLLTRELLYTAISRARDNVEIWASEKVLVEMIKNPTTRMSGLKDLLI